MAYMMTPGSNRYAFHACVKQHIDLTRQNTEKESFFCKKMCGFEVLLGLREREARSDPWCQHQHKF